MAANLMLLPAKEQKNIRLVSVPDEFEVQEAFRHVTGIIAKVEEDDPDYTWEDIAEALEEHGFETVRFILGPELD